MLVVDDDAASRAMLGLTLRRAGFRVQTASGGDEALERLKAGPFDWLVTDVQMSPMDGLQLARRAKELRPRLGVVFISALPLKEGVEGPPAEKMFFKPVPPVEFVEWLAAACR